MKRHSYKTIMEVLFMALKLAVLNIVSKELNGNQQTVPFESYGVFGKDNLDTVYYDPDTNRVTVHLSGAHTGVDGRDPDNFQYSLSPDTTEMESHVDYDGETVLSNKLISFTPLPGKNDYRFMNFMTVNIAESAHVPPVWVTLEWAGANFSFDGK
ncbi:hypothetical protein [Serratia entomophila]|uniref:hypothetical protein n=2 Tax=Serratia entomophila TaxID=42906 RepID=UPI0021C71C84|nr:hypothetical protein [Serratia entomophila]